MTSLTDVLRGYASRSGELHSRHVPPCDALVVDGDYDPRMNRYLVISLATAADEPTVTHQIMSLQSAAEALEATLADYRCRLITQEEPPTVTPAVMEQAIRVLRKWAQEIHDAALSQAA